MSPTSQPGFLGGILDHRGECDNDGDGNGHDDGHTKQEEGSYGCTFECEVKASG